MDALAELRARRYKIAVEEADGFECPTCQTPYQSAEDRDECVVFHTTNGDLDETPTAHADCRRKPCPYCKALRDADAGDATGSMSEDEERASADWAR